MGIHNHHEFEQWPEPLLSLHVPLLKSLVPRDLGSIVCAITLGALFRLQQAKWQNSFVNSQNKACPLCEQGEDNRIHFLVECEKLMSLRQTFATLLYDISTKCPAMLSLPVAYKHPYHHYLEHTFRSLSWPLFLIRKVLVISLEHSRCASLMGHVVTPRFLLHDLQLLP